MQHYERQGLLILRAKCLRDGGRLQEKRNRTAILLRRTFCRTGRPYSKGRPKYASTQSAIMYTLISD